MSIALHKPVDLNEVPRYSLGEASRYLRMPTSTIANWVGGLTCSALDEALVGGPEEKSPRLSFSALIEVYVLGVVQCLDGLIDVGRGGQRTSPGILEAYLERIEWTTAGAPLQLFPFTRPDYLNAPKLITINPSLAFGRPVVKRRAISTSAIAERFKAGESLQSIAEDYDLEASEVEDAIRYEAFLLAAGSRCSPSG